MPIWSSQGLAYNFQHILYHLYQMMQNHLSSQSQLSLGLQLFPSQGRNMRAWPQIWRTLRHGIMKWHLEKNQGGLGRHSSYQKGQAFSFQKIFPILEESSTTVTTSQRKDQGQSTAFPRGGWLAASPNPGFQEHTKGQWQIYMSAGSQLATQTLLLEQDKAWRLAGRAAKHTLPVTAGAGCCSSCLEKRRVQENITWTYFQLRAAIIPMWLVIMLLYRRALV